jgi:hypothetical protein
MKQTLKQLTPRPLWDFASNAYWDWRNRRRHVWAQKLGWRWPENVRQLETYRNAHAGKRAFIIGNGPSLRQMDLRLLKNEITFGLNRIYLAFPEWGFTTRYLVSVNDLVLEQCAADMKALELPKFVTWRARHWLAGDAHTRYLDTDFTGPENFSGEATGRLFEGFTVTYVALQLAFFMGVEEAILIGVDHNFVTQGQPNLAVVSQGDDPNHFTPNYFGAGFKWQLPDLAGSERAYLLARQAYAQAGRRILDATVGGKLTIYPKVDYTALF